MKLGAFSVSLAVKDIHASLAFYQKLGFAPVGRDVEQNWLILRNGETTIGLFQGMFEQNCLTFNPGWNSQSETLPAFDDVRQIETQLKTAGLTLTTETEGASTGPAHIALVDPDGNPILIDQHV